MEKPILISRQNLKLVQITRKAPPQAKFQCWSGHRNFSRPIFMHWWSYFELHLTSHLILGRKHPPSEQGNYFECGSVHFMQFPAFFGSSGRNPTPRDQEGRFWRGEICFPMKSSTRNERPLAGYDNPLVKVLFQVSTVWIWFLATDSHVRFKYLFFVLLHWET